MEQQVYGKTVRTFPAAIVHTVEPDRLKIILFQVKGGSARIEKGHIERFKRASKKIEVVFNWAEKPEKSVLFDWESTDEEFDLHVA